MRYQLIVTRLDENPAYLTELERYNQENRYRGPADLGYGAPQTHMQVEVLKVSLEDTEFQTVKRAVVEVM